MAKKFNVPGIGYAYTDMRLEDFAPVGDWVVVREQLDRPETESGIIVPSAKNTTRGTVVATGVASGDFAVGDEIVFEEWQGGRWAFRRDDGEVDRCLIMSADKILCVVG